MEKRNKQRHPRRIPVRFWKPDDSHPYPGYTMNISPGGMFIGTHSPQPPGTRLRVEVLDPRKRIELESVVTHARRVPHYLRQVEVAGMGVRFLSGEELVARLLPEEEAPPSDVASGAGETTEYALHFKSREEFEQVFRRDISQGGLFIPTDRLAPLDTLITVEIHLPGDPVEPIRLPARVVRRFSEKGSRRSGATTGLAVAFTEPEAAAATLRRVMERLS